MAEIKFYETFDSNKQRDNQILKDTFSTISSPVRDISSDYYGEEKPLLESSKTPTIQEMMKDYDEKYGDHSHDSLEPEIHPELYIPC